MGGLSFSVSGNLHSGRKGRDEREIEREGEGREEVGGSLRSVGGKEAGCVWEEGDACISVTASCKQPDQEVYSRPE